MWIGVYLWDLFCRFVLVVCYKIVSFGVFDIKKFIWFGFVIVYDLCIVVGLECFFSFYNVNVFLKVVYSVYFIDSVKINFIYLKILVWLYF